MGATSNLARLARARDFRWPARARRHDPPVWAPNRLLRRIHGHSVRRARVDLLSDRGTAELALGQEMTSPSAAERDSTRGTSCRSWLVSSRFAAFQISAGDSAWD